MTREDNIRVFEDTARICRTDKTLAEKIAKSSAEQKIIREDDSFTGKRKRFESDAKIVISKKRTFEAALGYDGESVAVLNFASAKHAGGGVENGSFAQEECLCRCSTLFFNLTDPRMQKGFCAPHRQAQNPLHNDDVIYTPGIVVLKRDDDYSLLPERRELNCITCAAPNLRGRLNDKHDLRYSNIAARISDEELTALSERRATRIMDVASFYENDVIILGAFGCGAFMNDPNAVAKAFGNATKNFLRAFKTIEFAVYCSPRDGEGNYLEFRKAFADLL